MPRFASRNVPKKDPGQPQSETKIRPLGNEHLLCTCHVGALGLGLLCEASREANQGVGASCMSWWWTTQSSNCSSKTTPSSTAGKDDGTPTVFRCCWVQFSLIQNIVPKRLSPEPLAKRVRRQTDGYAAPAKVGSNEFSVLCRRKGPRPARY